jgi:hypothetical protein
MRTAGKLEAELRHVLRGSVSTGVKEDEPSNWRVWAAGFLPCYGPFSLGVRLETYKPFIYLILIFFSDCGKPRILNH